MKDVYINDIAVALPNAPVGNDEMESVLGMINETPSKIRNKILKHNGIKTRYYAVDKDTGEMTHTNAELTAQAIKGLKPYNGFSASDIECLCCGSTVPDVTAPGHGLMVHGELKSTPCEVISTAGICLSGISALKFGYMNVASGFSKNAVTTGSEIASSILRSNFFRHKETNGTKDIDKNPELIFDAEFLRWMLSDAAGAVYMSNEQNPEGLSLKVDWIDHISFASDYDTCMYSGGRKNKEGKMVGFRQTNSLEEAVDKDFFALKQDTRLLGDNIVNMAVHRHLKKVVEKKGLVADEIDWFLPHFSSHFFKEPLYKGMQEIGFHIPYEKWFTNLSTKGNTGSASIYVMLEELFKSGNLKKGHKVLCFIPESGRFSNAYMLLDAV